MQEINLNSENINRQNIFPTAIDEKSRVFGEKSSNKLSQENILSEKVGRGQVEGKSLSKTSGKTSLTKIRVLGEGTNDFLSCRFEPEDNLIATAGTDGMVNVFSLSDSTDVPYRTLNGSLNSDPLTCMRWRPQTGLSKTKQVLVTGCGDGTVTHWHIPSGKMLHRMTEPDNQILCLDYNRDGSNFATAGKDRKVRIYDEGTKSLLAQLEGGFFQNPGHSNRIFALKFHPEDPNVIISAGWDSVVYFWDIRDKGSFASIYGPAVSGDALDIQGNEILTGSWRNRDQLELWDFASRKRISTIDWEYGKKVDTAFVYTCQFSKNGNGDILAGCSNLNEVKVFERSNQYRDCGKISNSDKSIFNVDFANSHDMFSFCGADGRVTIAQLNK